jgi:hypothetical protein
MEIKWLTLASYLLLTAVLPAQGFQLNYLADLSSEIWESSGLLYWDGRLITHNDSGGAAVLYEIDTLNGSILREVLIENASNVDWEDLSADSSYLYIGDIGNNYGTRTDLVIYRLAWQDYLNADTVTAETIYYSYADQTNFSSSQFATPYDAEALQVMYDSVCVFTKNWTADQSRVYCAPKTPGSYVLTATDSLQIPALVTGVDLAADGEKLLFTAYDLGAAYVIMLDNFVPHQLSLSEWTQWELPLSALSAKVEAVAWRDTQYAFLSKEGVGQAAAALYRLDSDYMVANNNLKPQEVIIYPQPAKDWLNVTIEGTCTLVLFSLEGQLLQSTVGKELNLQTYQPGSYILQVFQAGIVHYQGLVVKQ